MSILSLDSSPIFIMAVLGGMAIGAALAWLMRSRLPSTPKNPVGLLTYYGGSLLLGGLVLGGCALVAGGGDLGLVEAEPTATQPIVFVTATAAPLSTETPTPPPPVDTATPEPVLVEWPDDFTLSIVFEDDDECGGNGFEFDYRVVIEPEAMEVVQLANGITLTGPFNIANGEFTVESGNLPGREVMTGVLVVEGETLLMGGEYTYIDGSASTCDGRWPFSGEAIP